MSEERPGTELFRASARTRRVWFVLVLSIASAIAGVWAGLDLWESYGMRPAEGGELKPAGVRLAWGAGVAGLGLAFLSGMLVYGHCYVTALDLVDDSVHVRTLLGRARVVPMQDLAGVTYRDGKVRLRSTVNAPWLSVRERGRRLPYIVDLQGEMLNSALIQGPATFDDTR